MRKIAVALVVLVLAGVGGCGFKDKNPLSFQESTVSFLPAATPADSAKAGIRKPPVQTDAVPPSFTGWSVVSGSRTEIFGPIWDQDWKIYFYLPNRSTMPRVRTIAAKNVFGKWLTYDSYAMLYDYGPSGPYYRVVYVFGGNRANAFGINMIASSNWALYYHD